MPLYWLWMSTNVRTTLDLRALLDGVIDDCAEMGAPEEHVSQCRRQVDALMESLTRLNDWRTENGLPVPETRGISVD